MNIKNYLGNGNIINSLLEMRSYLVKEIYRYCLLSGIDPDSFDYKVFLSEHKNNINSLVIRYYPDLVSYCDKLDLVNKRIEELNAN